MSNNSKLWPTRNRHQNALAISAGACNPSGIALSIVDACQEVRAQNGDVCNDPAIRLIVYQLAYIVGVTNGISEMARGDYFADSEACRAAIAIEALQGELSL